MPMPYTDFVLPKERITDVLLAALALPYAGTKDPVTQEVSVEPEYFGLSNAEVMALKIANRAAGGDLDAAKLILDRILGKPKQQVETTNLNLTLGEYLSQIDFAEDAKKWDQRILDAETE